MSHTSITTEINNSNDSNDCCICLSPLHTSTDFTLECGHILHSKCLLKLLKAYIKTNKIIKCPLCCFELSMFSNRTIVLDQFDENLILSTDEHADIVDNNIVLLIESRPILSPRCKLFTKISCLCSIFMIVSFTIIVIFLKMIT